MYQDSVSGTAPNETVSSNPDSFTGTLSGSQLTLNFSDLSVAVFGDIKGDTVQVEMPQSDGSLVEDTFSRATPSQYDQALVALNTTADEDNAASETATSIAQVATSIAQAQQQAESNIAQDASTVADDISGLSSDEPTLAGDVQTASSDLHTEGGALATVLSDEKGVVSEAKQYPSGEEGQVCDDANQAGDDASQVADDATQVEDDATQVTDDLGTVESDVNGSSGGLEGDFAQLQSAVSASPGYLPSGTPTQQDVQHAVNAASKDESSAVATTNASIGVANGYVTKAYEYVDAAFKAGGCGSPPQPPSPQLPIAT